MREAHTRRRSIVLTAIRHDMLGRRRRSLRLAIWLLLLLLLLRLRLLPGIVLLLVL